jgi:hypothetical protein
MQPTIQNIAVLGAGRARLIAALALRRMIPSLRVRVTRSPEIGLIGGISPAKLSTWFATRDGAGTSHDP